MEAHAHDHEAPTVVSLCSGVGGMDLGLQRAGWQHLGFCEGGGDPDGDDAERAQYAQGAYRRAVLAARFPGVPIHHDLQADDITAWARGLGARGGALGAGRGDGSADASGSGVPRAGVGLIAGGTPCQDLSVAGQRRGLAGARSGLFFDFARVVDAVRPRWVLWENVPGALSSHGGRDFGVVLGTLADIGYGLAWRILDSRYFGVPQRRRRVFILGAIADGDPRAAAERAGQVLAVGTRCQRHPATRTEARDSTAGALGGVPPGGGWRIGADEAAVNHLVAETVTSKWAKQSGGPAGDETQNLVASTLKSLRGKDGGGIGPEETLLAFHPTQDPIVNGEVSHALGSEESGSVAVGHGASVRRLTPTECERLQALPDGWTDLGGTPDSKRYAALGDAVTASVAEWLGRRILAAS